MTNGRTDTSAQRQKLAGDTQRPRYHFLPPANWMNDPNGLIQWKGRYHLFYQYNPSAPKHAHIHWGHAVSTDLVHWTDLPIALTPASERADAQGCWSGCAIDKNGTPTIFYTGVYPQCVCLASSDDELLTWRYFPQNPIIAGPPAELGIETGGEFRDPFAWREGDYWYLLMGSTKKGVGGQILLYRSVDLVHWEYRHPLLVGDASKYEPVWTGMMWECPNMLTFGEQRALLYSVQDQQGKLLYPLFARGTMRDERFSLSTQGKLVHGGYFYAPQVLRDEQGRYIMWGWLMEGRSSDRIEEAGWAGVMSLPVRVAPLPGERLSLEPVPELKMLRGEHWHADGFAPGEDRRIVPIECGGDCLELLVECEVGKTGEFGFRMRCSPDDQEQTRVVYRAAERSVAIEREQASLNVEAEREESMVVLEEEPGEVLSMHIFLDCSVIEVFVNSSCYIASRIYPERKDSLGCEFFARGEGVRVRGIDVWKMDSIWDL